MEQKDSRFAVLIDADNVSPKYIKYILDEVSDQGVATYKRIYGDWTDISKKSWKEQLLRYSINPIQQYSNTNGKNSTDSAMIIDAMDLLYTRRFDGYCLVTSDSDFTGLAVRLREEGLVVYGFGEQKTPEAFRNACHKFVFTEVLRKPADIGSHARQDPATQALLVALMGCALSLMAYWGVSLLFNHALSSNLADKEFVCRLPPLYAAAAVAVLQASTSVLQPWLKRNSAIRRQRSRMYSTTGSL